MIKKSEFIWNTVGSLFYSFFNVFILMCCTRVNGVEIAGMFSISYATGCILNAIGDMGIRIFQVTDTERKYSFNEYLIARVISIIIMIAIGIIYLILGQYQNEKLFICIMLILIRIIDNLSETFQAELQLQKKLDLAGKALLVRNVVEVITFIIFNILTQNIYFAFGMMFLSSVIMFWVLDYKLVKKTTKIIFKFDKKNVIIILKECIPLGVSTLVSMYVINAVKYAIDGLGNNEMQTFFNILYMPTFVINLISILVMKPFLKPFGEYWNNGEYKKFIKLILVILGVLVLATIVIEIGCAILGIKILNFIFGVNLDSYQIELLILILSGLFYALSTIMFYALGTIRKQRVSTIVYCIAAVIALLVSGYFVNSMQILGATVASVIVMFSLFLGLTIAFILGYRKANKIRTS